MGQIWQLMTANLRASVDQLCLLGRAYEREELSKVLKPRPTLDDSCKVKSKARSGFRALLEWDLPAVLKLDCQWAHGVIEAGHLN